MRHKIKESRIRKVLPGINVEEIMRSLDFAPSFSTPDERTPFISAELKKFNTLGEARVCMRLDSCIKLRAKEGGGENNAIITATKSALFTLLERHKHQSCSQLNASPAQTFL